MGKRTKEHAMLTAKEINDICIRETPKYIETLKNGIESATPLADALGISCKGNVTIRLTIKE